MYGFFAFLQHNLSLLSVLSRLYHDISFLSLSVFVGILNLHQMHKERSYSMCINVYILHHFFSSLLSFLMLSFKCG